MSTGCVTTTHWATHYTRECAEGGNGQCDGNCYEHNVECSCSCHTTTSDLPQTVEGMRDWHDEHNGVIASHEHLVDAITDANRRNEKPVDGSLFVALGGQDRFIVMQRWS